MKKQVLSSRLRRRELLKASSATMASPALAALGGDRAMAATLKKWDAGTVPEVSPAFAGHVTVGYYDGEPGGRFRDERTMVADGKMSTFNHARIQVIDGGFLGRAGLENVRSVSLYLDTYVPKGEAVCVWYRQFAPVPQTSPTMSFSLPLDPLNRLTGWLVVRLIGDQQARVQIPVTVGSSTVLDTGELRSGYYAIAVTSEDAIAWDGIELRGSGDGNTLCLIGGSNAERGMFWVLISLILV